VLGLNSNELTMSFTEYKNKSIDLIEFLKKLPDETERIFEIYIVHVISETPEIEHELLKILESNQTSSKVSYNAFYCLCTYYRRRKDTSKYGELLELYKYLFSQNPTFNYLKSMFLMQRGKESDINEAIILSRKAIKDVPNNVGISHCYAEIIAEAFEESVLDLESDKIELDYAIELVQDILKETSDYAKFYCTYGRLLALAGRYKEAKAEILIAIDKENSSKNDYALRIGEYQRYLIQITSKSYSEKALHEFESYTTKMDAWNNEMKDSIEKSEEKIQNNIQSALNRNLEFLGFFAALVSFIIASVQLLTKASFQEAFKLILELGGMNIIVLSSFGIILHGNKYIKRSIVVFIMGITCIIVSLYVH
jgi:tetratricopeptide (TPR) repeat protein